MKRRWIALFLIICCVSLFLTGSKPRLVGEEKAKEAGLAFIEQMFDAKEKTASVMYYSMESSEIIQTGDETPVYFYRVFIPEEKDGNIRYFVDVNAQSGEAFRAHRSISLIPEMTIDQRKAVSEVAGNGDWIKYDFGTVGSECQIAARDWIKERFALTAPILGFIESGYMSDDAVSPGATTNFYVVLRDGTIYYIDMIWPQMQVLEIGILNQIDPYDGEM